MSTYIPCTDNEQKDMLAELSMSTADELFAGIPDALKVKGSLNLPSPMSEMELVRHLGRLADRNANLDEYSSFLGAGVYDHFIPSVVGHILSRQEFYTAYTPYQPEISQGTLQAIFEYQTMICELTGMDVANASMYDGASALAEAALMACQITRKKEIITAGTVHPESRTVLNTYARFRGYSVIEAGCADGRLDLEELEKLISENTAAVIVQSPNFFGILERLDEISRLAHSRKALLIASVDPISLGIIKSPGELGADIVIGEGQALGNQMSFGGPGFGFFATKSEYMRKMPGRIVGETVDSSGKRGFVLTIQTREQHIRREKATSNICSNQALSALAATVYMTVLGKRGIREIANLCIQKAHYTYDRLVASGKFKPVFNAPFFKEFVVQSSSDVNELNQKLLKDKIIGGYAVERHYPEIADGWLIAVTEKRTRQDIDNMVSKAVKLL